MRRVDVAFLESILVGGQGGAACNGQQQHHPPALSSSPSSGTSGFLSAWSAKQTPFEVLYTAEGFRRVRDWFSRHSAGHGLERPATAGWTRQAGENKKNECEDDQGCDEEEGDDGLAVECDVGYLTERQFVEILCRLADFNDTEALEVFDIFGTTLCNAQRSRLLRLMDSSCMHCCVRMRLMHHRR